MTTLYLATGRGPIICNRRNGRWRAESALDQQSVSCVATDPYRPERLFYGTRCGIWRSDDAGGTWDQVFEEIPHQRVTALAVNASEQAGGHGVVYVGTEPSAVFRSEDGGESWRLCKGLTELPSSSEWSFPPRPDTHHVRWIEPDPHDPGRLFVAIEAGALIQTPDGGRTWKDRVSGAPRDTHQLVTHPDAPGLVLSASGDGCFESDDGGDSWERAEAGLSFRYCWSAAADPADPKTVVLSAAPSARQAHTSEHAESAIYRRTDDGSWREVRAGLPESGQTRAPVVARNPSEPGVFYLAADPGLYLSEDGGTTWQRLDMDGLEQLVGGSRVHGLVVVEVG